MVSYYFPKYICALGVVNGINLDAHPKCPCQKYIVLPDCVVYYVWSERSCLLYQKQPTYA